MSEPRTISIDGVALTLIVERKRVKNVNARLRGSTITVSAPFHTPAAVVEAAIATLARRLLRRARASDVNREEDALALARSVALRFPSPPPIQVVTFVTTQNSRWGSYSRATGTIRLNAVLLRMPRWVLESVVSHELAHVVHPHHSPKFWELLRRVDPDTDRANAFLAGVSWLAGNWPRLPAVERALLASWPDEDGTAQAE